MRLNHEEPHRQSVHRPRVLAVLSLLATTALIGCRQEDEIRTYRIAKDTSADAGRAAPAAPPAASVPPTGEPTDRMLGAILPGADRAWFFKAVGPKTALDASAESIQAFLASVQLESERPGWDRPEGWTEQPGSSMRLATLKIPSGDAGEIEMSVIGLPLLGDWDAQVLDNVNRWRKQLKLPPTDAAGLVESAKPLEGGVEKAALVDLDGWFEAGGMAPFAGGTRSAPSTPSSATPAIPTAPTAGTQLKSDTPEGWVSDDKANSIRKVSIKTPGGAEVTGFVFPAAGMMADPLFNANRWRGEIGLPPTTAEELAEQTEPIELLGEAGKYFGFVGEGEATSVAMVQAGDGVWFFKLRGPTDEVAAQNDVFRTWLGSLSL